MFVDFRRGFQQIRARPLKDKPGWMLWPALLLFSLTLWLLSKLLGPLADQFVAGIQKVDLTKLDRRQIALVSFVAVYMGIYGSFFVYFGCLTAAATKIIVDRISAADLGRKVVGDPGIEPGMGLPGGVTVRCRTLQRVPTQGLIRKRRGSANLPPAPTADHSFTAPGRRRRPPHRPRPRQSPHPHQAALTRAAAFMPPAQSVDSGGRSVVNSVAQPRPRFFEA